MSFADFHARSGISSSQTRERSAIDMERAADAAHYVIANTEPGKLGYVKLNRILWHADLDNYRWHGVSITGLRHYSRTPQGPMSPVISRAVRVLVKAGKVAEQTVSIADYLRREMLCLKPPEHGQISPEQVDILEHAIKIIAPLSAIQLRQMTLAERLWQETKNRDPMAVATGSIMTQPLMAKPLRRAGSASY